MFQGLRRVGHPRCLAMTANANRRSCGRDRRTDRLSFNLAVRAQDARGNVKPSGARFRLKSGPFGSSAMECLAGGKQQRAGMIQTFGKRNGEAEHDTRMPCFAVQAGDYRTPKMFRRIITDSGTPSAQSNIFCIRSLLLLSMSAARSPLHVAGDGMSLR